MGSKAARKAAWKESIRADVRAGRITAAEARKQDSSGQFSRDEFDGDEVEAKRAKAGQWSGISDAEHQAAMEWRKSKDVLSQSDKRAKAAGVDPREYAAAGGDLSKIPSKNALTAPDGFERPTMTTGSDPGSTLARSTATSVPVNNLQFGATGDASQPSGYRLQGDPAADPNGPLIRERDEIKGYLAKYWNDPEVAMGYQDRLREIDAQIARQDATQAGGVANFGFNNTSGAPIDNRPDPGMAAEMQKVSGVDPFQTRVMSGDYAPLMEKAAQLYPNDQKAQATFINEFVNGLASVKAGTRDMNENLRVAQSAGQRWVDEPGALRWLTEPVDNLINGDPTGVLRQVAGTGVTASFGLGPGGPSTSGSPPNVDAQVNNFVNDVEAAQPGMGTIGTPGVNPNGPNAGGSTMPGYNQSQDQAPTNPYFTPMGGTTTPTLTNPTGTNVGSLPTNPSAPTTNVATGNPAVPLPPSNTSTGGTPAPNPPNSTNNVGPGAQTGGTPPGGGTTPSTAGGGNWWEMPGAREALAAAGILVGAGGSLIAAKTAADGQIEAARIQKESADKALDLQRDMYDQTRLDTQPWRTAGTAALTDLQNFDTANPDFVFNMDGPNVDPSYAWRLDQGIKALENSSAARGMLQSGNTLKAITEYGQGAASQEYNNAFNRAMTQRGQKLNRLQSLAGIGQTAVQQVGNAGQNYASGGGNALITGGQAQGQGAAGAANAWASGQMGGVNAAINGLSEYYRNDQQTRLINALLAK